MTDKKKKPIRVLMAKFDLESHDRGFYLVANMLKNSGMEVILSVFQKTLEAVENAVQEDVDVIGLSALSGDTSKVFLLEIIGHLKSHGMDNILLIAGGRILGDDADFLVEKGVNKIFGPGTQQHEIVDYIMSNVTRK